MMRTATTALRLEPELKQRADALAAAEHSSFSAVVRDALNMYLSQREAERAEIDEAVAAWQEYEQTGLQSEARRCLPGCGPGALTARTRALNAICDHHAIRSCRYPALARVPA